MKCPAMVLAIVCTISAMGFAAEPVKRDFESDAIGSPPAGFEFGRTGSGPAGKWVVRLEKGGTTNHVLVQESADKTDYRFPVAVAVMPWRTIAGSTTSSRAAAVSSVARTSRCRRTRGTR